MKGGRGYFPRVALSSASGNVLRYLPSEAARALVDAGSASPSSGSGRVREVVLNTPASTHAERTGPPTAACLTGTKFTRWVQLEASSTRVIEHHPRALYVF